MMRARSSNWLLISLGVLAALVAVELYYQVGAASSGQAAGPSRAPSAEPPVPMFALEGRETFSETLTRPLFMPNRRPPQAAAAESPTPASQAASPRANRYALSAIIIVDSERIALLTDTATGDVSRVREGESLSGWQVEAIRPDGAVLRHDDTREELTLRTFTAPMPVSPGQRAGAAPGPPANRDAGKLSDRPRRPKRGPRRTLKIPRTSSN